MLDSLAESPRLNPQAPPLFLSFGFAMEERPSSLIVPVVDSKPWLSRKGRRIDFAARDANNRRLAKLGEQWVVRLEHDRLQWAGRPDLADRVDHVAESTAWPGTDVCPLTSRTNRSLIEVKTTVLGKEFPFYVTRTRCGVPRTLGGDSNSTS
jgi:hypothetical protein